MSNPLDELLSGAIGSTELIESSHDLPMAQSESLPFDQTIILDESHKEETTETRETSQSVSPSGEMTSTCKVTFTTVRAVRKRFITNIPDEIIGSLIERANAIASPLIKDCTGQQIEEMIIMHTEVARILQTTLIEHVRLAHDNKAPTLITRKEIEALRAKRAAEKQERINLQEKKINKVKKAVARAEEGEKLPLWEKLTRSSDKELRGAGKFLQGQAKMGIPESSAVKIWNDLMQTNNPGAVLKNPAGIRLDVVLAGNEKKGTK